MRTAERGLTAIPSPGPSGPFGCFDRAGRPAVAMGLLLVIAAVWARPARGQGPEADAPVVLVLAVASDPPAAAEERLFVDELALLLADFRVEAVDPEDAEFPRRPLNEQLTVVRELVETRDAVAAMWLAHVSDDMLLLHLVALSTGRALVRLFEQRMGEGSAADLAVTAGELLGTAYMFEPPERRPAPALARVADDARVLAAVPSPEAPPSTGSPWAVDLMGTASGGVAGSSGPTLGAGGLLAFGRFLRDRLWLGLAVGGHAWPLDERAGLAASGFGLLTRLEVGWAFLDGDWRLGPLLGVQLERSEVDLSWEDGPRVRDSWWGGAAVAAADLRWRAADWLALCVQAGFRIGFQRHAVVRRSDGAELLAEPWLGWWVGLGLQFPFGSGVL
ncbi:MAG: hypothetical protein JXB32_18915 [Deltaproteobacteria bacterium]|nr:hypothetical protein [Deltaproteobacteria bacterium]